MYIFVYICIYIYITHIPKRNHNCLGKQKKIPIFIRTNTCMKTTRFARGLQSTHDTKRYKCASPFSLCHIDSRYIVHAYTHIYMFI